MVYKKHCCYGTCNSDTRYQDRPEMAGVFFINFPKPITQLEKCEKWIRYCGRPKSQFDVNKVNKSTFICSNHFYGGKGPTAEHPDPIPATACPEQIKKMSRKRKAPTDRKTTVTSNKKKRLEAATALLCLNNTSEETSSIVLEPEDNIPGQDFSQNIKSVTIGTQIDLTTCNCNQKVLKETGTQTEYEKYVLQSKVETIILRNEAKTSNSPLEHSNKKTPHLRLDDIKGDDKKMKFFTGLTYLHFMALFNFLGSAVNNLKYWNQSETKGSAQNIKKQTQPIDEMFIMLVRLRRGFSFYMLSFLFDISETSLRVIFTTWLQLLYCHFKDMKSQMFPDRSALKKFMPQSFKSFKNVRCSIDCTEFFVEMPKDFAKQGNLYSNYKSHHTFKCLIAVAPNGACVYVSDLFEGAISDRDIFNKCGIMEQFKPGDLLLVDRGFTVQDLLLEKHVHVNMPPFLKGRDKLTAEEELLTKKIARARIHIERFNERCKKIRLISGVMPLKLQPVASQVVYVACCLVNFQGPLAK